MSELLEAVSKHIVLVSGPVASGKTTLSKLLEQRSGFHVLSTREILSSFGVDRRDLQVAGAALDASTAGRWVRDALLRMRVRSPVQGSFVVDSVRTGEQVRWVREDFGWPVHHVHLTASPEVLFSRFMSRSEGYSYEEVISDPVERAVSLLSCSADLVLDTEQRDPYSAVDGVLDYLASFT